MYVQTYRLQLIDGHVADHGGQDVRREHPGEDDEEAPVENGRMVNNFEGKHSRQTERERESEIKKTNKKGGNNGDGTLGKFSSTLAHPSVLAPSLLRRTNR